MAENTYEPGESKNAQGVTGPAGPGEGKIDIPQRMDLLEERLKAVSKESSDLEENFGKLENNINKTNTFMMWAMSIAVGVFVVSGIMVSIDYFKNNEERQERLMAEIQAVKKDYYSKEDLKNLIDENNQNKRILDCIKIKGWFAMDCLK